MRYAVSHDNKVDAAQVKERGHLLRRLFGRGGYEPPGPDTHSGPSTTTTLDLRDIQGFILRGYKMPMVRTFPADGPLSLRQPEKLLGRFSSVVTNLTRRRSPLPKIGT